MLPSADQSGCNTIATSGDQSDCASALSSYMAANLCQ
jgi:hypothetical protein